MSLKIRLSRQGAKKRPEYLVVVVDSNKKRDGEYIAKLGHYFPKAEKPADKVKVNFELAKAWIAQGAQPSVTVGQLLKIQA
ncbi:MAG: 30S ribosomal protein S16 [Bdellovibrionales bacterium]|nr:30S ribosomal protein S16 [Bdellovibrionales bacterium]